MLKDKKERIKHYLAHCKLHSNYAWFAEEWGVRPETVRTFVKNQQLPNLKINVQSKRNDVPLAEQLKKVIANKRRTVVELADTFDVSPKKVLSALKELQSKNVIVDHFENGEVCLAKEIQPVDKPLVIDTKKYAEKEFCFGVVADTHIGSKYERLDVLGALYDKFVDVGVKDVYHCGNWIDGECRFNQYDIYVRGVEGQVTNFIEKYPQRKGITTHLISGDDHEGWYVQREHLNIGQYMQTKAEAAGRKDLIDLGYIERDIAFKAAKGQSIVRVIHAGGGSTYAISYTAQKYVESLQGGEKPAIVLIGHYHKFDYGYPREVHTIQPGCTEDQTPFMRKKKIQAMVGGCIVWVKQNELGIFTSVKVEWIPFYDKKFYQYKW